MKIPPTGWQSQLPPTNHWSLLLTLLVSTSSSSESKISSVGVDVAPSEPGEPSMVVVESNLEGYDAFTSIDNFTKTVSVDAAHEGITVAVVFNLIIQKKRDHYIFAPVGEGCRFWLYTITDDFASANFIGTANALEVQSALVMYWPTPKGTPAIARPMAKGRFPKPGDWEMVSALLVLIIDHDNRWSWSLLSIAEIWCFFLWSRKFFLLCMLCRFLRSQNSYWRVIQRWIKKKKICSPIKRLNPKSCIMGRGLDEPKRVRDLVRAEVVGVVRSWTVRA